MISGLRLSAAELLSETPIRGELVLPLPIGLVYDDGEQVILEPDQKVQATVRLFFETFRRVGSANGVVRDFAAKEICFPRRPLGAPVQGEILWGKLELSRRAPPFGGDTGRSGSGRPCP